MAPRPSPARGVTLLELAIVLAVMGILATAAFGYYAGTRDQAKRLKAFEDMNTLRTAVKSFRAHEFNAENRRPASPKELVSVVFTGTESRIVRTAAGSVEQDETVSRKVNFIDAIRKTPWGLDYNIDRFNVIAWNTDRLVENRNGIWGERLLVPYTNVTTDEFDASPAATAWTFATSGNGVWAWETGAVALRSPHDLGAADAILMQLQKEIVVKGAKTEVAPDPTELEETRLMDVEWGCVVTVVFDYAQTRTAAADASIDDDVSGPEDQARLERALAEHAIDYDPVALEREMIGAVYLWPKSKPPVILGAPNDADAKIPFGLRFSDRRWMVVPAGDVLLTAVPPEGSVGEWAPGRHEVKFVSKYDGLKERYILDVSIDGDLKYSIDLPPEVDDTFRLTISPDPFTDATRAIASEMSVQAVTVSAFDFSKHYTDVLWPDARTYGR